MRFFKTLSFLAVCAWFCAWFCFCANVGHAHPRRFQKLKRYAKYSANENTATSECPCSNPDWCLPISGPPVRDKEVFGFHNGNSPKGFETFNWTHITTIAWAGEPELMCAAHSHGVRVILSSPSVILTDNVTARAHFVDSVVSNVQEHFADGVTFDYESPLPAGDVRSSYYAALISETRAALHKAHPSYQVSTCVAWSPDSIDGRNYPMQALADASDLLYVMDYDTRSQVFDACLASANAPYFGMIKGLQRYFEIGISPSKLVLGVPWYGYQYTCLPGTAPTDRYCPIQSKPFRGVNCSDAAGSEIQLDDIMMRRLVNMSASGKDENMHASWFNTFDGTTVSQYWYDDADSLSLKYSWAKANNVRGVGPYTFEDIDLLPAADRGKIWEAFDAFF